VLRSLSVGGTGAEIGVWKGDFSAELLRVARPKRLYLVDPWHYETAPGYEAALYGGGDATSQDDMDAIHDAVRQRFASELADGRVEVLRSGAGELAASLPDASLDWVYIDGNHLHQHVLADLTVLYPKVRPGGLLCGDDYGDPGWWEDGVTTAVADFVCSHAVRIEEIHNNQFILRRPA
jgi:SAM-dependent methyltransferase